MSSGFQVEGQNATALFTLKIHRGDGMCLLAMNWKNNQPPQDFVGFAIEYQQPGDPAFYPLKNRLCFPNAKASGTNRFSTLESPIQKFRWVHFPRNADLAGDFTYRVTPVFMDKNHEISCGDNQEAKIQLSRQTYPGKLNVAFTRGFVSSQAFVDRYKSTVGILPTKATQGLDYKPTDAKAAEAWDWMGFEARQEILSALDKAIADNAEVRVVAYDLNEPEVVKRMEKLGSNLKVIIDDSKDHKKKGSSENDAAKRLVVSAGKQNVKRQHMGQLQHNKFIAIKGPTVQLAVCGSTNFSWRAFFVQNNNAVTVYGENAVKSFCDAFDDYWTNSSVPKFAKGTPVQWTSLGLKDIDAEVSFSPHTKPNARLQQVADDIANETASCLLYSLAFLYEAPGSVRDAIAKITKNEALFVYGISDKKVKSGIIVQKPDGNLAPIYSASLSKDVPQPFKAEPKLGKGTQMHHKFLVIDFDKPTARVYLGSYNFSVPADLKNGENLLVIRDRRVAVSYMVEALSMLDHYHFRVTQQEAKKKKKKLELAYPPSKPGDKAWWEEYYASSQKIRDRELFA